MPTVRSIEAIDRFDASFEVLGYECMGEFGIPGRRYYRKGGEERTHRYTFSAGTMSATSNGTSPLGIICAHTLRRHTATES